MDENNHLTSGITVTGAKYPAAFLCNEPADQRHPNSLCISIKISYNNHPENSKSG